MKRFGRPLSLLLACLLSLTVMPPAFAEESEAVDYKITNPYDTVDWDNWNRYRTQFHAHTLYSDGEMNITDVVEAYYAEGYDISSTAGWCSKNNGTVKNASRPGGVF